MRRETGRRKSQFPGTWRSLWTAIAILVLVVASACGGDDPDVEPALSEAPAIRVIAVTNVLADWAKAVGGDRVEVASLIPTDVDPHGFQPGPRDAAKIAEADLIIAIGLGMEGFWLDELLHNVARDSSIVLTLGDLVDPILNDSEDEGGHADDEDEDDHADDEDEGHDEDGHADDEEEGHDEDDNGHADDEDDGHDEDEEGHADDEDEGHDDEENGHADDEEDEHGHDHGAHNPHFWFDPLRVMIAIDAIAERFAEMDPAHADEFRARAAAYKEELQALDDWTLEQVGMVPPERRLILGSHDYYRYFADRYDFEVLGIILSVAEDVEPSAEHLAGLVELMRERNLQAVFGETTAHERLASALANEAGATLVRLYSDSLGPEGSGAATYIEMVKFNVTLVVEALK
ncbi:MAG: metal ABC transporter substrate-binding protein [Chloroflexi bacterium]|nr:metal ABC transporter substrate-binding protein [Chloroflexota bacterium]